MSEQPAALSALSAGTNLVVLHGHLSSDPVERTLPSGDLLTRFEVTTTSGDPDVPSATAPVVFFGARRGRTGKAGDAVLVVGGVRRRFYQAGGSTQSNTEVLATKITLVPTRRSLTAAKKAAAATIDLLCD